MRAEQLGKMKILGAALWVVLLTMQTHYFYSIGVAPFPIIAALISGVAILFHALVDLRATRSQLISARWYILFWLLIFAIGIFDALVVTRAKYLLIPRILAFPLFLVVGLHMCLMYINDKKNLVSAMRLAIIIHLAFFWAQVLFYYAGLGFLDYMEPLTGETQRAFGGSYFVLGVPLIRATGLFNEPGTFTNFVFVLFLLYKNLEKADGTIGPLDVWVILSMLMSFSVFGLIFTALYLVFYVFQLSPKRALLLVMLSAPIVVGIYHIYLEPRFFSGVVSTDSGFGFRAEALSVYGQAAMKSISMVLFGVGIFTDASAFLDSELVWNDLGFLFYFVLCSGVAGLLAFVVVTIASRGREISAFHVLMIFAIFLSKISISHFLLWLCLASLLHASSNKHKMLLRSEA
ncbi:hypothetical protein [Chitiniphilus shinanonensis]|uniref:hypothetical protein n=1 Tax=Chitiniphilus shinanonensis TaxID=553088 RepID=UPI0033426023